jgi:hypothetical protein
MNDSGGDNSGGVATGFLKCVENNFAKTAGPNTLAAGPSSAFLQKSDRSGNDFGPIEETKRDEIVSNRSK